MSSAVEKAKQMAENLRQRARSAMERVSSSFAPAVNKIEGGNKMLVLAVLPKGGPAAKNPQYLHCVEHALGLGDWAKQHGAILIATDDKDRSNSELDKNLPNADIIITSPYYPAYLTRERLDKAKKLQLIINLSEGADHIDLQAASEKSLTVVEVAGCAVESVAEDEIMRILILLRNFIQGHEQVRKGKWDVCAATADAYDIKNKVVGTLGAGKVGTQFIKRLQQGWDVKTLLYYDVKQKKELEDMGAKHVQDFDNFLSQCDAVAINTPLKSDTRNLFNAATLNKMKKGAVLVDDASGGIVDRDAIVNAVKSEQLKGFGADVWDEDPPSASHPWRLLPRSAMTPHMAGLTIDAQESYGEEARLALSRWTTKEAMPEDYYLVRDGKLKADMQ